MVDQAALDFLVGASKGSWNDWRQSNGFNVLDLSNAQLNNRLFNGFDFSYCNLRNANLINCELKKAKFYRSNVSYADLSHSKLIEANFLETQLFRTQFNYSNLRNAKFSNPDIISADFTGSSLIGMEIISGNIDFCIFDVANFSKSIISETSLMGSSFYQTNLAESDFTDCRFKGSIFIETNIEQSTFKNCHIFGVSCWKMEGTPKLIKNLNISDSNENPITLDNLEMAQFLYLLLNNSKIKLAIDNITTKIVLILGRFSDEQKPVLDFIRTKLPMYNYIPVIFDFNPPNTRDIDETISILAPLSKFIIVDITNPRSTPQEMKGFIESHPSIPVQPIKRQDQVEYGMFGHFQRYPWVLPVQDYRDIQDLEDNFEDKIILPVRDRFEVTHGENFRNTNLECEPPPS